MRYNGIYSELSMNNKMLFQGNCRSESILLLGILLVFADEQHWNSDFGLVTSGTSLSEVTLLLFQW